MNPMDEDLRAIREGLSEKGYFHARGVHLFEWFEAICASLGDIRLRTDIQRNPEKDAEQKRTRTSGPARPGVYTDEELVFHTDNPNWNLLGWYCVRQDEKVGESLLLDLGDAAASFSREDLDELCAVRVYLPVRDAAWNERMELVPLFTRDAGSYDVYWVPWLIADGFEETHAAVLGRFREWRQRREERELISLRLEPGEVLFVHNNRMLHSRRTLSPGSQRHLVRFAVAAPDVRRRFA